jgi:hypothetical protein
MVEDGKMKEKERKRKESNKLGGDVECWQRKGKEKVMMTVQRKMTASTR